EEGEASEGDEDRHRVGRQGEEIGAGVFADGLCVAEKEEVEVGAADDRTDEVFRLAQTDEARAQEILQRGESQVEEGADHARGRRVESEVSGQRSEVRGQGRKSEVGG